MTCRARAVSKAVTYSRVRVLIISDMEGVGGIANSSQTNAGQPLYEEGRKLYTGEINAAVRGARAAGAKEVCVMDHHGAGGGYSFNSLIAEELDPGCEFVVQEEWTSYTGFLEEGCDACLLVGMHAMAGTPDGVINHTVSGQTWHNLRFNGTLVGETGINAAFAGAFGTPVALVTGDYASCREATALLGDGLTAVSVKRGIGFGSARMLVPSRARELIEDGAKRALKNLGAVGPYDPGKPCEIKVEYKETTEPAKAALKPGVELIDPRTVVSRADDWLTAWRQFFF
jgi:D-amino peptidase